MEKAKVIIIATAGLTTDLLYKGLLKNADITRVFLEEPETKKTILKRRFKKLGAIKTIGQILFMLFALPFIANRKKRIDTLIKKYKLTRDAIPINKIKQINTIHNTALIAMIIAEKPAIVFINGTRILKKELLNKMPCKVVNIHVGITPKYRGVHGGYWAIQNKEPELFGVTLHFVDEGIDTGKIIAQQVIVPNKEDNYKTYPILQYCEGVQLINSCFDKILTNKVDSPTALTKESKLYYHPTLWGYWFG